MLPLLSFHRTVLEDIHDPTTNDLLVIARGLGLRRIVCNLLKLYDSPQNLVLLVNASPEEESEIGEELGIMGCRKPGLRVVGYETGSKERCVLDTSRQPNTDIAQAGDVQEGRPYISHLTYPCRRYAPIPNPH